MAHDRRHSVLLRKDTTKHREVIATLWRRLDGQILIASGDVLHEGAMADERVQSLIAGAAGRLSIRHQALPSGAGHDAQSMAAIGPMGMIVVPSIDGISHTPRELTSRGADCARGADVLLHAVPQATRQS